MYYDRQLNYFNKLMMMGTNKTREIFTDNDEAPRVVDVESVGVESAFGVDCVTVED